MTKKKKYISHLIPILKKESLKIGEISSLIWTLTATFLVNKVVPLYYRALDKCKTPALKKSNSNIE